MDVRMFEWTMGMNERRSASSLKPCEQQRAESLLSGGPRRPASHKSLTFPWMRIICLNSVDFPLSPAPSSRSLLTWAHGGLSQGARQTGHLLLGLVLGSHLLLKLLRPQPLLLGRGLLLCAADGCQRALGQACAACRTGRHSAGATARHRASRRLCVLAGSPGREACGWQRIIIFPVTPDALNQATAKWPVLDVAASPTDRGLCVHDKENRKTNVR
jgi:hypothetical protein